MNVVADFVKSILPPHKVTPSGWHTINAPCCVHRGETQDTRKRGGFNISADGNVSFHCFNCSFKASYIVGRHLTVRFRKLLTWMNVSETQIQRLVIETMRLKSLYSKYVDVSDTEYVEPEFETKDLPVGAMPIEDVVKLCIQNDEPLPTQLIDAVELMVHRRIDTEKYQIHWCPDAENNMINRVIVPLNWKGEIVGYSARSLYDSVKPKYFSSTDNKYVFNIDEQKDDNQILIVTEGLFDAMSIDAVGLLGNECNDYQADIINSLQKQVIVVPDFDRKYNKNIKKNVWSGENLVNSALEYGWNVSFPQWNETCKDINDAVVKYGKLFTLKTILNTTEHSKLKIELHKKRYN